MPLQSGFHKIDGVNVQFWNNPEPRGAEVRHAEHAHAVHNIQNRLETVADLLRAQGYTVRIEPIGFAWEMSAKRYLERDHAQ